MVEAMKKPLNLGEVSDWIGLDRMTIYTRLKEGTIPAHRIGHQWRFDPDELQEWFRHQPPGDVMKHLENLLVCIQEPELGSDVAVEAARVFFEEVMGREPGRE